MHVNFVDNKYEGKILYISLQRKLGADSGNLIMKELSSLPTAIACLTCIQNVPDLNTEGGK
jgi:hypothetical protein